MVKCYLISYADGSDLMCRGNMTKSMVLLRRNVLFVKKIFLYRGGTTNLRVHLQAKHSLIYETPKPKEDTPSTFKQTSLCGFSKPQHCTEARTSTITERIATMIANNQRPIRMVKGEGFLNLMNYLEPEYKIPCRKSITSTIHRKHEIVKHKLKDKLEREANSIALTTDIWASSATEAYITVSAHYISTEWGMISCVLETPDMPERHTGQNIADKLVEIVEKWGIIEKNFCCCP